MLAPVLALEAFDCLIEPVGSCAEKESGINIIRKHVLNFSFHRCHFRLVHITKRSFPPTIEHNLEYEKISLLHVISPPLRCH